MARETRSSQAQGYVPEPAGGHLLARLSNAMVALFRDLLGKGPDRCKAYWAGNDALVVLLGGRRLHRGRADAL